MSQASVAVAACQESGPTVAWLCTIWLSETFPARSSTGMVAIPIAISYVTIGALEGGRPGSEYLFFDDQPAGTMPYTPMDVIARMNRKPIGSGASAISMGPQGEFQVAPNGITAHAIRAGMKAIAGASTKIGVYAASGYVSSFMMFLSPSAAGCSHPFPTRFGPCRSCIHADTLRSASVSRATPTR